MLMFIAFSFLLLLLLSCCRKWEYIHNVNYTWPQFNRYLVKVIAYYQKKFYRQKQMHAHFKLKILFRFVNFVVFFFVYFDKLRLLLSPDLNKFQRCVSERYKTSPGAHAHILKLRFCNDKIGKLEKKKKTAAAFLLMYFILEWIRFDGKRSCTPNKNKLK